MSAGPGGGEGFGTPGFDRPIPNYGPYYANLGKQGGESAQQKANDAAMAADAARANKPGTATYYDTGPGGRLSVETESFSPTSGKTTSKNVSSGGASLIGGFGSAAVNEAPVASGSLISRSRAFSNDDYSGDGDIDTVLRRRLRKGVTVVS